MSMDAIDLRLFALVIGLVLGLVEVCKSTGMPARYAGLAAVLIGAVAGPMARAAGAGNPGTTVALAVITGIVAGLTASGTWSGSKHLFGSTSAPIPEHRITNVTAENNRYVPPAPAASRPRHTFGARADRD